MEGANSKHSSVDAAEVQAIHNWLTGASVEALQLPQTINQEIKNFVNECRHRKLIKNSVTDMSLVVNGGDESTSSSTSSLFATSSVTLTVAQRCATIIKSLVEWYVRDELDNDFILSPSPSSHRGDDGNSISTPADRTDTGVFAEDGEEEPEDDDENSNASDDEEVESKKKRLKHNKAQANQHQQHGSPINSSILQQRGRSIHSYIALSALRKRYIAENKDVSTISASEVTATQVVYLVLLIDKVGRKLADATAFHAVASNITMRAVAIVKRALEAPNVLVGVQTAVDTIMKRYDLQNWNSPAHLASGCSVRGGSDVRGGHGEEAAHALSATSPASGSDGNAREPSAGGAAGSSEVVGNTRVLGSLTVKLAALDHTTPFADTARIGAMTRVDTSVDLFHGYDDVDIDDETETASGTAAGSSVGSPTQCRSGTNSKLYTNNNHAFDEHHNVLSPVSPPLDGGADSFLQRQVSHTHAHHGHHHGTHGHSHGTHPNAATNVKYFSSVKDSMVRQAAGRAIDFVKFAEFCVEEIELLQASLASMTDSLCKHAAKHIYENETVLTIGCSHSTLAFFAEAAKTRSFRLVVLEGPPPHNSTQNLIRALNAINPNVNVMVQPDSNAYAVMSYCSKVFVSCDSVLATGGALCPLGTHPVCVAAKVFSTPVIVVAMTVKLIPWLPIDPQCSSLIRVSKTQNHEESCSIYALPSSVFPAQLALGSVAFGSGTGDAFSGSEHIRPVTSAIDVAYNTVEYVPPNLISLVVTDTDEFVGPHIHKHIRELYRIEDSEF